MSDCFEYTPQPAPPSTSGSDPGLDIEVVALGCVLMLARQMQKVWRNARDGWVAAHAALTEGIVHEDLSKKDTAR